MLTNVYVASVVLSLFGILGTLLNTLAIQLHGYEQLRDAYRMRSLTRGRIKASDGLIFGATLSIGLRSPTDATF